jgi:hypothetical protein
MIAVLQALEELLALSESMLSAAGAEDWETWPASKRHAARLPKACPPG